jgi:hypothetical protein
MQTRYITRFYLPAMVTILLLLTTVSSNAQNFQQSSITLPPVTYPNGQLSAIAKMTLDGNDNIYYSYNLPGYFVPGGTGQSGIQKVPFSNGSYSTPIDVSIAFPTVTSIPTRNETMQNTLGDINASINGKLLVNTQRICTYTDPQIAIDCNSVPSGGLVGGINQTVIPNPSPNASSPYGISTIPNPANSSGKPVAITQDYSGSTIWGVFSDSSIHAYRITDPDYPLENFFEYGSGFSVENANPDSTAVDTLQEALVHFPGNSYIAKFGVGIGPSINHIGDINIAGLGTNIGGIAVDLNNNIYIGDPLNSRVLMVPASDQNNPVTIATVSSSQFSILGVDYNGNVICWDQAASAANGSLTIIKLTPLQ